MCVLASTLHNLSPFSSHFSGAWPVLIDDFVEHMYRFDIPQHTRHQYSILHCICEVFVMVNLQSTVWPKTNSIFTRSNVENCKD